MKQRIRMIVGFESGRAGELPVTFQVDHGGVTAITFEEKNYGDHGEALN